MLLLKEETMKRQKSKPQRRDLRKSELVNRIKGFLDSSPAPVTRDKQTLERWRETYRRVRQVSFELNNGKLVPALSKAAIDFAASSLGMLRGNVIVFDTEDESAVLMDHAIYTLAIQK
jgi:hypothetical protein